MKTMILSVPEDREQWFRTLFDQFRIRHRTLTDEAAEDMMMARLIGEAMEEEVMGFIRANGGKI